MPSNPKEPNHQSAAPKSGRETIDILTEISVLLNTHLDRSAVGCCASLIQNGVNPEALVAVIQALRKEREKEEAEDTESS